MSVLVVDTSVWVEFFRGRELPDLERALQEGLVLLAPVVAAEICSGARSERDLRELKSLLADLPLHPAPLEHWTGVGALRATLGRRGLSVSTPDAHVAQCALEAGGQLWSLDGVFDEIARVIPLRLAPFGR